MPLLASFVHLHCTTPALANGARERSAVQVSRGGCFARKGHEVRFLSRMMGLWNFQVNGLFEEGFGSSLGGVMNKSNHPIQGLAEISLPVQNFVATRRFYEEVIGFGVLREIDEKEGKLVI